MLGHIGSWGTFWNMPVSGDTITLSGSSGTPNGNSVVGSGAQSGWEFRTNGTVWKLNNIGGDTQFQDGVEWNGSQDSPTTDYWVKFTQEAFSGDGTILFTSSSFGVWHKLSGTGSANRNFEIDDPPGTGATQLDIKVEISSDSSGTPVVAVGYYRSNAEDDT